MATSAWAGGLAREVIRASTGSAHAGGVVREIIRVSTGQVSIGGVVREALVTTGATSPATRAIVDGVVREVLVFTVGPALPPPPPINKHKHHLQEESDDEHSFGEAPDEWPFFTRRGTAPPIPTVPAWKPWLHHPRGADDAPDAEAWTPLLSRHGPPVPPVPPRAALPPTTLFIANLGRLMGRGP